MKKVAIVFCFVVISITISSCNIGGSPCGPKEVVDVKLTDIDKSFYPYVGNDTLKYIDKFNDSIKLFANLIDSINFNEGFGGGGDCGDDGVYQLEQYRQSFYLGSVKYLEVSISTAKYNSLIINVRLNGSVNSELYKIYFNPNESLQTMTIDGVFYDDLLISCDLPPCVNNGIEIFYSKSKGIIKLVDNFNTIFQVL